MHKIRINAEKIKEKRANEICKAIAKKMQLDLEFNSEEDEDYDFIDVLAVKSCGLFCGK